MLVTRFDPFKEFEAVRRAFFNLPVYNDEKDSSINAFVPKVNTREAEDAYHIEIDLPGMKKEDINIEVVDNQLIISGERKLKNELKEDDYYKIETSIGKFQRVFSLPENIDIEKIEAKSEDGVLEVIIPKVEEKVNKKKIEIK